ncbi:hypothetical protein B0O99DRAFT_593529 [Bisporella sp. PMI_857]|nr:hypothetical protein B0O99DRAFT_593529 [Bisporella sp. PMI_857]
MTDQEFSKVPQEERYSSQPMVPIKSAATITPPMANIKHTPNIQKPVVVIHRSPNVSIRQVISVSYPSGSFSVDDDEVSPPSSPLLTKGRVKLTKWIGREGDRLPSNLSGRAIRGPVLRVDSETDDFIFGPNCKNKPEGFGPPAINCLPTLSISREAAEEILNSTSNFSPFPPRSSSLPNTPVGKTTENKEATERYVADRLSRPTASSNARMLVSKTAIQRRSNSAKLTSRSASTIVSKSAASSIASSTKTGFMRISGHMTSILRDSRRNQEIVKEMERDAVTRSKAIPLTPTPVLRNLCRVEERVRLNSASRLPVRQQTGILSQGATQHATPTTRGAAYSAVRSQVGGVVSELKISSSRVSARPAVAASQDMSRTSRCLPHSITPASDLTAHSVVVATRIPKLRLPTVTNPNAVSGATGTGTPISRSNKGSNARTGDTIHPRVAARVAAIRAMSASCPTSVCPVPARQSLTTRPTTASRTQVQASESSDIGSRAPSPAFSNASTVNEPGEYFVENRVSRALDAMNADAVRNLNQAERIARSLSGDERRQLMREIARVRGVLIAVSHVREAITLSSAMNFSVTQAGAGLAATALDQAQMGSQ